MGERVRARPPIPQAVSALKPEEPFVAVGDIHGRYDLLEELLAKVDPKGDQKLVFLGDYIDRGPDTAKTLARLRDLQETEPGRVICLMGNHEKMLLDFVDDPLGRGASWLRNGGAETLASYGICGVSRRAQGDAILDACAAFEDALPAGLLGWLKQLPLCWNTGNIWCVHAAMDPACAPHAQKAKTMLWGHRDFLKKPRPDSVCVVHGHTTVSKPAMYESRIAIDTGAYKTDRLTAVSTAPNTCAFLST